MPKKVDKDAKRREIVGAALSVFAKKGVANTRMAEIAQAAGIGKGTIYEYFRDKNEIFKAAFDYFMHSMDSVMGRSLLRIFDPVEKIETLIKQWIEAIHAFGDDYIEIMMEFWAEGIRSKHDKGTELFDLKKMYSDYRLIVKSILDEGVQAGQFKEMNTTLTASILVGALDGIMLQWILDKSIFTLEDAADHLCQEFMRGIVKKDD